MFQRFHNYNNLKYIKVLVFHSSILIITAMSETTKTVTILTEYKLPDNG